ncbi:hypothetical protein HAZT_HAZT012147, partial [Hyalella azteca]
VPHNTSPSGVPHNTSPSGVPHNTSLPQVNLRHGMNAPELGGARDTCTSCAGTMILEFATLSRLTGDGVYEEKALKGVRGVATQGRGHSWASGAWPPKGVRSSSLN